VITIPLTGGGALCIIEPGNIRRMKEGRPLKIGDNVLICYTPDMAALRAKLVGNPQGPKPGALPDIHFGHWTPEEIDAAIKATLHMPEVEE
jgi:hypothetical protein